VVTHTSNDCYFYYNTAVASAHKLCRVRLIPTNYLQT
jgi:hypothetical protein